MFGLLLLLSSWALAEDDLIRLCTQARIGHGETVYWPSNGQIFTAQSGVIGEPWYWDNGFYITPEAGVIGANWYWENSRIITADAGIRGKTWTWDNYKLFSNQVGVAGTLQFFPNGTLITTSALEISDDDLLYPPCALAPFRL